MWNRIVYMMLILYKLNNMMYRHNHVRAFFFHSAAIHLRGVVYWQILTMKVVMIIVIWNNVLAKGPLYYPLSYPQEHTKLFYIFIEI